MTGFKEAIEVKEELTSVIIKTEGSELVSYTAGISDETIAKNHNCSSEFVAQIRRQYFGNLHPTRGVGKTKRKLETLEYENSMLKKDVVDLRDRFNRLLDNLQLNRVADVKHLKANQLNLEKAKQDDD